MTEASQEATLVRPTRVRVAEYAALIALTLATAALRIWLAINDGGPTLFFDEAYYIENARAIADGRPYATAHYPPLYSLLLVPGQLVDNWYPASMALSAAASALTVPAAWVLGRAVGLRQPIWAAACAALLPSALPYAGFMMSENLSTPIFVLALALALRARPREGWVLGATIAALILTKYLFLPAGVILVATYLVLLRRRAEHRWSFREWVRPIMRVAIPLVVAGILWVVYALASGITLFEAAGFSVPSRTLGRGVSEGDPSRLVLWIVVYGAILLLPALPTGFLVLAYLSRRRAAGARLTRVQAGFAVALLVLVIAYLAVTVQHSFGAEYNYPEPTRAWGRYLMHLSPCLLVLGLVLIQVIAARQRVIRPLVGLACLVATVGLAAVAWSVLYEGFIFGMQDWSFSYTITAADVFPFRTVGTRILFVAGTAIVALAVVWRPKPQLVVPVASAAVVLVLACTSVNYLARSVPYDPFSTTYANFNGSLPRKMFDALADLDREGQTAYFVLADGLRTEQLSWHSRFWEIPPDTVTADSVSDLKLDGDVGGATAEDVAALFAQVAELDNCSAARSCFVVTTSALGRDAERVDERWGQPVYFYSVPSEAAG